MSTLGGEGGVGLRESRLDELTTAQAGELARKAVVGRVEPFQFSPRYAGDEAFIIREVEEMFRR